MLTIGIMIERVRTHARRMHKGIIAYAKEHSGLSLRLLEFSDVNNPRTLAGCDGYIARILNDQMASALLKTRKPVIDVYCGKPREGILSVDENRRRVGIMAARHFLEHRFTRFAFCGLDGIAFSDDRRDAFLSCLARHRFSCVTYHTPNNILTNFEQSILRNDRIGLPLDRQSLSRWLKKLPKPIAVFCAHDSRAYQLIQVCHLCDIDVPRDLAVLGVDDDELTCNYTTPTLSSINHNGFGIGYAAIEAMHGILNGTARPDRPITVPPLGLTIRESSNVYPLDPPWLSDALVFIRTNIHKKISAADVYAAVGKSHTAVDRAFRSELGTSVQKTIIRIRLDVAKHLIQNSNTPFADIMLQSGFSSAQRFCHAIVAGFGKSPTALRANVQSSAQRFGRHTGVEENHREAPY